LERTGVIQGYRAAIDRSHIGAGFLAYVAVGLSDHTKGGLEAFERSVARAPEVVECHRVTGTVEYLLRIEVADLKSYKTFHTEVLGTLPRVTSIISYIVLDSSKDERA
jgi:DNA-binding Lrp family transcriptional regulator